MNPRSTTRVFFLRVATYTVEAGWSLSGSIPQTSEWVRTSAASCTSDKLLARKFSSNGIVLALVYISFWSLEASSQNEIRLEVISLDTTAPKRGRYLRGPTSKMFSFTDFHLAKIKRSVNAYSRSMLPQQVHSHTLILNEQLRNIEVGCSSGRLDVQT